MPLLRKVYLNVGMVLAVALPVAAGQVNGTPGLPVRIQRSPQEYQDAVSGFSALDLVRRALASNAGIAADRLDIERARGRLRQAGLSPNPSLEVERTTGRLTGSAGESEFALGVTMPIELGGKRDKRIDVARAELQAAEAEFADRERRLAAEVRSAHADALAALGELEVTSQLIEIDVKTLQVLQVRVTEGDAPPLELNLLRADTERFRSRRVLVQGRLEAAVLRLKRLAGMAPAEPLRFREEPPSSPAPPAATLEQSIQLALAARPDLQLARVMEEVTAAGLRLARSQTVPDLAVFGKYTVGTSAFDTTPIGPLQDRDKLLSFGATVSLPFRNRNQGNLMESRAAVEQTRKRREFIETMVRSEVTSAYSRYEAARSAVGIFQQGVLDRNTSNLESIRGAYEIGALRITDVLAEQRRSTDSQFEYIEALAETDRAFADLQAAMAAPVN